MPDAGVGFFASIYKALLTKNLTRQSCHFSSLISYIMPYQDSKIFSHQEGVFSENKIMQCHLKEDFFLQELINSLNSSMLPILRCTFLKHVETDIKSATETLSKLYREERLQELIKHLTDYAYASKK